MGCGCSVRWYPKATCCDYCVCVSCLCLTTIFNSFAEKYLSKIQRVQNCLACVYFKAPRFSSSLPLFKQLHWLRVKYCIRFILSTLLLTHHALTTHQLLYSAILLHLSNKPLHIVLKNISTGLGQFWENFPQKNPSETWTHPPTSTVNLNFLLCKAP